MLTYITWTVIAVAVWYVVAIVWFMCSLGRKTRKSRLIEGVVDWMMVPPIVSIGYIINHLFNKRKTKHYEQKDS